MTSASTPDCRGLEVFETALQDSSLWLQHLSAKLPGNRCLEAYLAFQIVSQAIRDQIDRDDAIRLGARLPTMLRGIYYDDWTPGKRRKAPADAEALRHVACRMLRDAGVQDPENAVKCVIDLLFEKVDLRALKSVERIFSAEIWRPLRPSEKKSKPRELKRASYRLSNEAS